MKEKDKSTVDRIKALRLVGNSYKCVATTLKISKSTAYKYAKSIRLNKIQLSIINEKIKLNRLNFKKHYAVEKKVLVNKPFDKIKSRILSHCLFDGSVTHYSINYCNTSLSLVRSFSKDITQTYGLKYTRIEKREGKHFPKYVVWFHSKIVSQDLLRYIKSFSTATKNSILPLNLLTSDRKFTKEFLIAFWEDEGCITKQGEILGKIKSRLVRDQLIDLHSLLNVRCTPYNCKDNSFGLRVIRNKENIKRFFGICFRSSIIVRGDDLGKKKFALFKELYKGYLGDRC